MINKGAFEKRQASTSEQNQRIDNAAVRNRPVSFDSRMNIAADRGRGDCR
ncbi:hypothetical protein RSSM_02563 [Rhodopirellula sallentina SM41]|uniref:Uncharacterized protein n=1 Tax=Rhodopirellula sallentina SM41 TaxID=1263870 RepID=M5U3Z9_9BACT|nr:hypothetical protein RSSM_02563 [Rhodopirellula sallentina SM41]